jgi:rRNA-processing protein FCF1
VKVLLDANALMMPAQFRIDLFSEIRELLGNFEPVVLPGVVQELTGLSRAKGNDGAAARLGLALAGQCTVAEGTVSSVPVDEQVIAWASANDCLVATNDRRVRDALLMKGIGVISMRKQKKLEILRR